MADEIDRSVAQQEVTLAAQLTARRPCGPVATGSCHFCEAELPEGMRWCNANCRDDWELQQAADRDMGRE
jgi:hypothetical protein